ncbi:MAG: MFS transporter [Chloroflexi bacterium]|nr:MFS transporter [Chloroflexota bacterium]
MAATLDRMAETATPPPGIERSLRLLPWWWVLRWAWLGEAIWVVYLIEDRGLTLGQVLLLEAVVFGAVVVAEVPTGVIADRYTRRLSLLLGSLFSAVAFVVFGLASSIELLMGSYVLFAIGGALMSGADEAFLYDSLRAVGRSEEFAGVFGRFNARMTVGIAVFTVVGGLMVIWTPLSWPIVLSGVLALVAAGFALLLVEPPREPSDQSFLRIGRSAAGRIVRTRALRWIVVISAAVQGIELVVFATFQPILVGEGVPVWALGWVAAGMMLVAAAGGWSSWRVRQRFGLSRSLAVLPALAALGVLGGASGMLWLFPVFTCAMFAREALHPLVVEYLSRRVPDGERATTLSVHQLAAWTATIGMSLGLGLVVDRVGLGTALAAASAVLVVIVVVAYLLWRSAGDRQSYPAGERGGDIGAEAP